MLPNPQFSADLVKFTDEILNGNLHFCTIQQSEEAGVNFAAANRYSIKAGPQLKIRRDNGK